MPSPVHPYSDYGVAMRTLKTARGWLGFMLFACVVAQFVGFALMMWTPQPYEKMKSGWKPTADASAWGRIQDMLTSGTRPATVPAAALPEQFYPGSEQGRRLNVRNQWDTAYTMLVPVTQIAGVIAVSSQAIIVFVTLLIVLVAQAPGVAQITRSLIWSVLLVFMFMPWQYFARDFPIPGVIYRYSELLGLIGPIVAGDRVYKYQIWLVYGRFIVWPMVGLLVLLITSERYRAGVMIAIGHPLQSLLQPRGGGGVMGGGGAAGGGAMGSAVPKPRPLGPTPAITGKKLI